MLHSEFVVKLVLHNTEQRGSSSNSYYVFIGHLLSRHRLFLDLLCFFEQMLIYCLELGCDASCHFILH